jgi:hypothetical protein
MLEFGQIYEIDSFLTEEELNIVSDEFENTNWLLNGGELNLRKSENLPIRSFWYKDLPSEYIRNIFKSKIENILNYEIEFIRVYGNGQTHSQTAWVHTDDNDACGSLVYYLHRNWLPHLGGHLIFVDNDRVIKSVFPHSNSAVIFNSKMEHCALEPTVYCLDMRVSIACKFKVKP